MDCIVNVYFNFIIDVFILSKVLDSRNNISIPYLGGHCVMVPVIICVLSDDEEDIDSLAEGKEND